MSLGQLLRGRAADWLLDEATGEALVKTKEQDLHYDEASATVSYLGKAPLGTALDAAGWQIRKLTFTGSDITVVFADGDADFDNIWDNRASLTY